MQLRFVTPNMSLVITDESANSSWHSCISPCLFLLPDLSSCQTSLSGRFICRPPASMLEVRSQFSLASNFKHSCLLEHSLLIGCTRFDLASNPPRVLVELTGIEPVTS